MVVELSINVCVDPRKRFQLQIACRIGFVMRCHFIPSPVDFHPSRFQTQAAATVVLSQLSVAVIRLPFINLNTAQTFEIGISKKTFIHFQ